MTNNISQSLVVLFKRYIKAFERFDASLALSCYKVPCSLSTPDDLKVLTSTATLVDEFSAIFSQLKEFGFAHVAASKASYQIVDSNLVMVAVHWQFFDQNQTMFTDFTALYHVLTCEDELKITNVISHEASHYVPLIENLTIHRE